MLGSIRLLTDKRQLPAMNITLNGPVHRDEMISRLISWGHWFAFFNALAAALFGMLYLVVGDQPLGQAATLFNVVYGLGHFTVLTFLVYLATLFPLTFAVAHPRSYFTLAALLAATGWLALIVDLLLYAKNGIHLGSYLLAIIIDDARGITGTPLWSLLLGVLLIALLQGALGRYLWRHRTRPFSRYLARRSALALVGCFILGHLGYIAADASGYLPITSQRDLYPLSYPATARNLLSDYGVLVQAERDSAAARELTANQQLRQQPAAMNDKPDYLLILIDGWRRDGLDPHTMPNSMAITANGNQLRQHFATASNGRDSLFSLLYGVPASYLPGVSLRREPSPLLHWLTANGYQLRYWGSRDSQLDSLLDNAGFSLVPAKGEAQTVSGQDRLTAAAASDWASHRDNAPSFTLIRFSAPAHMAYPADYRAPFQPDLDGVLLANSEHNQPQQVINRYRNSLHFVDSLIAEVLHAWQQSGRQPRLLLAGTFGFELDDRGDGVWGYGSGHGDAQIAVPLLLQGWPPLAGSTTLTSHYDLLPSIVGTNNADWGPGSSWLDASAERRTWLFLGNAEFFAIRDGQQLTEFRRGRRPLVQRTDGQRLDDSELSGKVFSHAYKEMRRYLSPNSATLTP